MMYSNLCLSFCETVPLRGSAHNQIRPFGVSCLIRGNLQQADFDSLKKEFFKGTVAPDFLGALFCPPWKGLPEKSNRYQFLNFSVAPYLLGGHFKVLNHLMPKISEIPGISEMVLQMGAAVLGDFLNNSQRTAGKV